MGAENLDNLRSLVGYWRQIAALRKERELHRLAGKRQPAPGREEDR